MFCDNELVFDQLASSSGERSAKLPPRRWLPANALRMAEVDGQPWQERIAEWLEGTGCDAWVMKGLTQDPEEYAQHRIRETTQDTSRDARAI